MSDPDVIYEVHDDQDVSYQIRPYSEGVPGSGYTCGAEILTRDSGETKWVYQVSITKDALPALAKALALAAADVEGKR